MDRIDDNPAGHAEGSRTDQPARDDLPPPGAPVPLPPRDEDAPFGVGLMDDEERLVSREAAAESWEDVPDEQLLDDADEDVSTAEHVREAPAAEPLEMPVVTQKEARMADGTGPGSAPAPPVSRPAVAPAEGTTAGESAPAAPPIRDSWDPAATPRHLAVELKRIEARITELLEGVDPRRKRRLEGTRRWLELQDDIAAMRFEGRIDEARVREINALCAKRHRLFRHLNFLVATRPTWNT